MQFSARVYLTTNSDFTKRKAADSLALTAQQQQHLATARINATTTTTQQQEEDEQHYVQHELMP